LLESDDRVILIGEDIGVMGGAFRATEGLYDRFGARRVVDSPMSEAGLVGAGIGMAVMGLRPIVELQFADFISCAYDQLVTQAAKLHYRFEISVPLVVRAPSGGGVGAGPFHSQNPEGIFAHIPGLKVVCPGSVQDAYDLLLWSVADPNPVVFLEHKGLYRSLRQPLERRIPAWSAHPGTRVVRHGTEGTVVAYGAMTSKALSAASLLSIEGIELEVLDLRMVSPIDLEPILRSVEKTSRLAVVHEDTRSCGVGAEIAARVGEEALFHLDAPLLRITAPDCPVPFAQPLEDAYIPSVPEIVESLRRWATT
jgi:2-oxoisovalerate dehydrogenase E1 component beta subunit